MLCRGLAMLLVLACLLSVQASVGEDAGHQRELLQSNNVIVNQNTAYDAPSESDSYCFIQGCST